MPTTKTRQPKHSDEPRGTAQRELDAGAAAQASLQDSQPGSAAPAAASRFRPRLATAGRGHSRPVRPADRIRSRPPTLGLQAPTRPDAEVADAGAVYQLVKWDEHGAKKAGKGNPTWVFKDAEKARAALAAEPGESMAKHLEEADWELGVKYATDRGEGADNALKLLYGLAEENLRKALIAERNQEIEDTGKTTTTARAS